MKEDKEKKQKEERLAGNVETKEKREKEGFPKLGSKQNPYTLHVESIVVGLR